MQESESCPKGGQKKVSLESEVLMPQSSATPVFSSSYYLVQSCPPGDDGSFVVVRCANPPLLDPSRLHICSHADPRDAKLPDSNLWAMCV